MVSGMMKRCGHFYIPLIDHGDGSNERPVMWATNR